MTSPNVLYDYIAQGIYSGRWIAGQALPSQRWFASEFGLARGSVREVFGRLEAAGMIDSRPGAPSRCCNLFATSLTLPLLGGDTQVLRQVLEVRAFLEGEAAYYAARNASDEQLEQIDEEYRQVQQRNQGETTLEKAKADLRFHTLIAESCHQLLITSFSQLFYERYFNAIYEVLKRTLVSRGRYPESIARQHQEIHRALLAREPYAARLAASNHVLATLQLLQNPSSHGAS